MSVIAHVDHGKSTLTDSLLAKAGILSADAAGTARLTDTREDEALRGITIKSTGISLYYETNIVDGEETKGYLINLIDSPGHVDFSSEVTAALRVTDGALVVVDYIEGCAVQTETVLRQALAEKIKPVLMVNKIDRGILEQQVDGETMYQNFIKVIENANVIIATYENDDMGSQLQVSPEEGTVAFGSALFGWAFTINRFAEVLSKKFGIEKEKLQSKLWGDNYFDKKAKKWKNHSKADDGSNLTRVFVDLIMEPIIRLCKATVGKDMDQVDKILKNLNIEIKNEDRELEGKKLMKLVFQNWINAADALLEMIILKLPSPVQAQKYRAAYLYEGPIDDPSGQAITNCDQNGPVMCFISKMVPTKDKGRFYAFGRVFSGVIKAGCKVRIMGSNYEPGSKHDLSIKNITATVIQMGGKWESVPEVPCGNTVGLVGVDQYLKKQGTIATDEGAHNIRVMKYSVSPVVRVAVSVKNATDLPKLLDGLKKLSQSDPLVQCSTTETNEHVVAGCGELHVEICLKDLKEYAKCDIIEGDPVVPYKETITEESSQICLAKSKNKHNRIFVKAQPMGEELTKCIEDEKIGPKGDPKERTRALVEQFDWERNDAQPNKLWCFGPDFTGPNTVVDQTTAVQNLQAIRDSIINGFQWASKEGVLCSENMRGCRFNLVDVLVHRDNMQRGGAEIEPATRRALFAAQLTAKPALQEPVYLVEIQTPDDCIGAIYQTLTNQRRGVVIGEEPISGTPLVMMRGYLPVAESFGFTGALRAATQGRAFPQCVFDHWGQLESDPLEIGSKANVIVETIRQRKGMKAGIPGLEHFHDKLQ